MDGFGDSFVPPAEGAFVPPAEGAAVPPTESAFVPPVEDAIVAPAEGAAPPPVEDPAAEFLAREQDQLAGLDDDILPPATDAAPAEASAGLDADDLFGGSLAAPAVNGLGGSDLESFEMLGGGEVAPEAAAPEAVTAPEPARSPVPHIMREEPEKIKLWREGQRVRLEEKDAAENENKEELKKKAKQELEDWYKQHEEQVAKTRQANRDLCKSAEKELVAETTKMEPGTEWERITKLCDFNPKTAKSSRDISRMRSIILQVKQNPPIKA